MIKNSTIYTKLEHIRNHTLKIFTSLFLKYSFSIATQFSKFRLDITKVFKGFRTIYGNDPDLISTYQN